MHKIISIIHRGLVANQYTRIYQKIFLAKLRSLVNSPDATADLQLLFKHIELDAILDIGCYSGETISDFLKLSKLKVYGFEPNPYSYQKALERHKNDVRVRLFQVALADANGESQFHINKNQQTSSLLKISKSGLTSWGSDVQYHETIQVRITTLDEWVANNLPVTAKIILKVDIQGAELAMLKGAKSCLKNNIQAIYSEAHIESIYENQSTYCDIDNYLRGECNFILFNTYPCMKDRKGKAVQLDALWIKTDILDQLTKE